MSNYSYQMPLVSLSSIVPGSSEFNSYNGQTFPGYISTDGQTMTACTAGNWQPSAFATSWITCREGYFWPTTGLSDLSNYPWVEGYIWAAGLTTGTPSGAQWPTKTYCEGGNVVSQRWPDGYKNPSLTAQASCLDWGSGYFCYQTGTPGSYIENVVSWASGNTQWTSSTQQRDLKCQDGYELNNSNTCVLCAATKYWRGVICLYFPIPLWW